MASERQPGIRRTSTRFHPEDCDIGDEFEEQFEYAFKRYGGAQRYGACSRQSIHRHMISFSSIISVFWTMDLSVWLSMSLGCLLTWACLEYEIFWNIQLALVVSPIIFPLAFSINESYRRREKVLDDMAAFMGGAAELYWLHRDWTDASGLPATHPKGVETDITELLVNLIHYAATEIPDKRRSQRLGAIYRIFSRLAKSNDLIRSSHLPGNPPLCTRLIHYHNIMMTAFERMRVVREYRTPRGIRGYTKTIVFFLPIFLAPYWAYMARTGAINVTDFEERNPTCQPGHPFCPGLYEKTQLDSQHWSAYFSACMCALIFGSLQTVQDSLDDPFDGIGQDDIDLHLITSWSTSALWENESDQRIPVLESAFPERSFWCGFFSKKYVVTHDAPDLGIDAEDTVDCPETDEPLPPSVRASLRASMRRKSLGHLAVDDSLDLSAMDASRAESTILPATSVRQAPRRQVTRQEDHERSTSVSPRYQRSSILVDGEPVSQNFLDASVPTGLPTESGRGDVDPVPCDVSESTV